MKKYIFVLLVLLTLPALAQAQDFDIDVQPIQNTIGEDEPALYNITITNHDDEDAVFRFTLSPAYIGGWSSFPASFRVSAGEQESVVLRLHQKTFQRGIYTVQVNVRIGTDIVTSENLRVTVSPEAIGGFPLSVRTDVTLPDQFDPRNSLTIQQEVVNRNSRNINRVDISLVSDFFEENYHLSLSPREETSRQFTYDINPLTPPGTYFVRSTARDPETGEALSTNRFNLNVIAYSEIVESEESSWNWFKLERTVTLRNDGNIDVEHEYTHDLNLIERLLSSSDEEFEVTKINGSNVLMWDVTFEPGEQKEISLDTDYRLPLILLILFATIMFAYLKLRSPLVMVKGALTRKKDEESKDLKVRIFLRNRSNKAIYNITISDKLPKITEYVPSQSLGSLKPSRVKKSSKKGTHLYWDIEKLEPQEERILTYKAKSQLPVVGNITLQPTKAKFEEENGRERTTISKNVTFDE